MVLKNIFAIQFETMHASSEVGSETNQIMFYLSTTKSFRIYV